VTDYDVIIVGGGPGGYAAARRLGQAGRRVLLADADGLGGSSLYNGTVPMASLLESAGLYHRLRAAADRGITTTGLSVDWPAMQAAKQRTVATLAAGLKATLQRHRVTVVQETAEFLEPGRVLVGDRQLTCDDVIIATGSVPNLPPLPGVVANPRVLAPAGLLELDQPPERLIVLGADVTGLECANLFALLGSQVTVIDSLAEITNLIDQTIAAELRPALRPVRFRLNCQIDHLDGDTVYFRAADGSPASASGDAIVLSLGRQPRFDGWGAETSGLDITCRGVTVDDCLRTNLPGVWAVGDVTGHSLFAHAALRSGEVAAALIVDPASRRRGEVMRWSTIPYTFFGQPQAAGVGLTEQACAAQGFDQIVTGVAPLALAGRFIDEAGLSPSGLAKVIVDQSTRQVLGIHLLGPAATEVIGGLAAVVEMEMTVDELGQIVFPNQTVAEGLREACWAVQRRLAAATVTLDR
jgi:dihydrolipoamide dehydrogenase